MRALRNPGLIILVFLSILIGSASLTRGHEWGDDWASYVMQAQSILEGNTAEFIERNTFTIFESSFQIGPVAYPWGYPLILTPALILKGVHALTLKIPGLFLFAGFLIYLYLWTKNRLTRTESLLLVSLFAFNPILIKYLDHILSDIPLLFFIMLGLYLMLNLKEHGPWWNQSILGTLLFLAFFVRTTGILLFASYLAYQFTNLRRNSNNRNGTLTDTVVTTLTFVSLWLVTSLLFPNGQGSYLELLKGLTPAVFGSNITNYFYLFGAFFGTGPMWTGIYYTLVVFFLIGAWARRDADTLPGFFLVLYLAAMLLWPEWQGIRFIFPILPIFVYFAFQGIRVALEKLPGELIAPFHALVTGFWLVIIVIFLYTSSFRAYLNLKDNRSINGPFDSFSSDVYNYIRAETSPESVIVFWKPRAMRLFTNRHTFMSIECKRLLLGDYVVLSKKAENSQIPPEEIGACNLPLIKRLENNRFVVYEIQK